MENAIKLREKLSKGQVCLGTGISFVDPAVTEALSGLLDFVWIDMEHGPLTIEAVQGHCMATKGTNTAPLVRVPWNDQVYIMRVLDAGAAGVVAPMVRTAAEATNLVKACLYPPQGVRGFGPRRVANYGRAFTPQFCSQANAAIIPIAQIEHLDAINNINEILAVPGLVSIVIGPFDLAGSMGHTAEPRHPEVIAAIEMVIREARRANVFVGLGAGDSPEELKQWVAKGVQWFQAGADFSLLLRAANQYVDALRI